MKLFFGKKPRLNVTAATPTARQLNTAPAIPLHVQIEITWRCNWRCVHCYLDDYTVQPLATDCLRALFYDLQELGTAQAVITGGEPLVRADLFELLCLLSSLGIRVILYSNGHRIDQHIASELSRLIETVEISVLSGDPDIHDALTGVSGSFHRAMRAVSLLHARGVRVIVKTPVLRPAYSTLKKLERDLMEKGIEWSPDPEISQTYTGNKTPIAYKLTAAQLLEFFQDFPQYLPSSALGEVDSWGSTGLCAAGRTFCFIDALGNVYPCLPFKSACDVRQKNKQRAPPYLGNITQQSIKDIWRYSPFLSMLRQKSYADFVKCQQCAERPYCTPCMALSYEEYDTLFEPARIRCEATKAMMAVANSRSGG